MNLAEFIRKVRRKVFDLRIIDKKQLYLLWERQQLTRMISEFDIDCVFDVGANFGQYATMLRKKCGYRGLIISFEPMPDAAAALRKMSANDPLWIIVEMALADKKGETTFNIMAGDQFSSLSEPSHDETSLFTSYNVVEQSIVVKTDTLDNVFAELSGQHGFKRPFLKMDTQGFDVEILRHADACIGQFIGLQSELAVKKLYAHSVYFCDAIRFYESLGFTLSAFVPNNAGHFPLLVETDCLMVNNRYLDT